MHSTPANRSPLTKPTPTPISVSSALESPLDIGNSGAKRRNSWHRQRGSTIDSQLFDSPLHDADGFNVPDLPQRATVMSTFQDQPVAGPSRSPRPIHRSYESQHSLESVQSAISATPTDGEDQMHLAPGDMQHAVRWKGDTESGEVPDRRSRRLDRRAGHYGETSTPRRTMERLQSVSRNIRRVSVRVVNLAGITLEDRPIRLDDDVPEPADRGPEPSPLEAPPDTMRDRLRGRTLGIFGSKSGIRCSMLNLLLWRWTEPLILLLILADAVILTIQAHKALDVFPRITNGFFKTWEDYALFVLFVIFTFEILARIIVTGLILDPETRMTDVQSFLRFFHATSSSVQSHFNPSIASLDPSAPMQRDIGASAQEHAYPPPRSRDGSGSSTWVGSRLGVHTHPFQLAIEKQQALSERNLPYLRHSWNRIDFIAVVSFWVMFILAVLGVESTASRHIFIFRALSVLRVSRLLAVTNGTTTIMRSLKIAGPLLVNVAMFVLFAVLLFSIVGVQSFKGSMRRNCQLGNLTLPNFCGGQVEYNASNTDNPYQTTGYYTEEGVRTSSAKGYICPLGLTCQEQSSNPNLNIQSFDNIFYGALQVVIIAGANGWAPTMYDMMDSDFYTASIFFIVCIVILNFWLVNMFVAVITNTFGAIRAGTKKSAFGAGTSGPIIDEKDEGWAMITGNRHGTRTKVQEAYLQTKICWVFLIFVDLVIQGTKTSTSSASHLQFLDIFETTATVAFDIEMIWRVWGYLPNWRAFSESGGNNLDLLLAVITTIIQIPQIKTSSAYAWLTIFQLGRFYRVILAVPTMRPLLLRVFGNLNGLFNMTLFLLITNVLGALVAVQLFRGDLQTPDSNPDQSPMNFAETYSAFLAMYQVFSSENWTNVLYLVGQAEVPYGQALIAVLFFVAWFVFANFIMLQMFIAVINENFEVAEEQKRARQLAAYLRKSEPASAHVNWLDRWNPYRFVKAQPSSLQVENMPSALVLPLRSNVVQDKRGKRQGSTSQRSLGSAGANASERSTGLSSTLRRLFSDDDANGIAMFNLRSNRRESTTNQGTADDELENLDYMPNTLPDIGAEETHDTINEENAQRADFIDAHPTYDKTFWLLSNDNPIRYLCQLLVTPANGTRVFGTPPSQIAEPFFKLIIILAVVGGIIVATKTSPMYRRDYYQKNGLIHYTWFDIADIAFGGVLVLEFVIKITADGFIFTPNAYLLSIWNVIDFGILIALLINMVTTIVIVGGLSRITRSLRAFRALRLITFFPWMRDTFYSVLFAGAQSLFEAALLALLYMVPYAIWGLNLFAGLMFTCTDGSVAGKSTCVNEYVNSAFDGSIPFLAPRAWVKPSPSTTFSFDNFGSSLLILFEVVSFEGWIDVMTFAMNLVGQNEQPSFLQSQHNSIFFVTYDLLGAVIILTLFVSIIIGNFSSRSGMALLTEDQKRWIDLKKLIKRQGPSKRPKIRPTSLLRSWCYDRAVSKNGWWSRCMTGLYIIHILALATQTFTNSSAFNHARDYIFLVLTTIYLIDIIVRMTGLGIRSFTANGWNLFDVFVVLGSFGTTVPIVLGSQGFLVNQLQKLFLVCIAFKLVQKNNSLNQLFKTAVSSLPAILKLLLLWFTLFIFFAIVFVEVFGLTRWESAETRNQNYREFSNALIMLAFMCFGEGWNQYMHDFTVSYPRCTNSSASESDSDCGSRAWAYVLFIAWNLLSMYIFVNMFTGLVVENFSYVFQLNNSQNSINRQEMRSFKKIWATFDVNGTGYIQPRDLALFLARLSGVFEVRVYPSQFSVQAILQECRASADEPRHEYSTRVEGGIDLRKLAAKLSQMDQRDVAKRRLRYNRLFQEARRLTVERGKGISFTNMLLLLAHYKMINDDIALQVNEMIDRRDTTIMVDELVDRDRVLSLLKMIACRRRYASEREAEAAALRAEQQGDIPAIVVEEDEPTTPQHRSWDITQANRDSQGFRIGGDSPSPSPIRPVYSPETPSYHSSPPTSPIQGGRARARYSDASVLSGDWGPSRRDSVGHRAASPHQVLSTLDSSVWGDMMDEEE
ncbi:calcium channel protein [Tulasnella sp. JGI-2019a]|nr:calcium channel protein [Tulasnella sp. JGI-2019a]